MEKIEIEGTAKRPYVHFDANAGLIEMGGKSIMEDPTVFYEPLEEWLDCYAHKPQAQTEVHFRFEYFNTSASKWIISLAKKFKQIIERGFEIDINWYYDDEDLYEYGTVIRDLVDIPINLIEID